jgi:predicted nucleic acid-binding protein
MILIDTSVWIDFLRGGGPLVDLLERNEVLIHAFVIGELACGSLPHRKSTIQFLQELPIVKTVGMNDVLRFIEKHSLMARGIGYVDVHLLAAATFNTCQFFTHDKRLRAMAEKLSLAYPQRN